MLKTGYQNARRNGVCYECATPDPAQALLFGNGNMGGSLYTPDDSVYLTVSRSDLWNTDGAMGAICGLRLSDGTGLLSDGLVRQRCCVATATITLIVDTRSGPVSITVTCLRERDLLLIDIVDSRSTPQPFSLAIDNWHADDSTTATATWHTNTGASRYLRSLEAAGLDPADFGPDPLLGRTWGLFTSADASPAAKHQHFAIATVCLPPGDGDLVPQLRTQANDLLAEAAADGDQLRGDHQVWWQDFWSRSYVHLESTTGDAEYEERVWYTSLYYLACAHGGSFPARFNGATYLLDRDHRSWDFGYWFQNMRELYWPLLASGHWDFMRNYFEMYLDAMPLVTQQTLSVHGIEAPAYCETQWFWGGAQHLEEDDPTACTGLHHNFSNNLEICLLMHWYVEASGDETFRLQRLYPFLQQVLRFFMTYATTDADGQIHITPSNAVEVWPSTKDPMPDIAGLRVLLPLLVEWGKAYGADADMMAEWQHFSDHLAPIPIGHWTVESTHREGIHNDDWHIASELDPEGIFLPAADKTSDRAYRHNMENPELYVVFPWGLVGLDSPASEKRRVEETWHHRTWRFINSGWAQDVPQLARIGWAELARERSLEHASRHQRFPNGGFISPAGPHFHGQLTSTPYLDSAGVHLTGLHEMLLQSYSGVLRICPSVSAQWSGQFKLHALGGFTVEAHMTHGQLDWAIITATRDATLRLPDQPPVSLQKGQTHTIGTPPESLALEVGQEHGEAIIYPGYKTHPPTRSHRSGHWHDESVRHGQIGLASDGKFPATR